MYTVYMHVNKITGKKYIGVTVRKPEVRWGKNGGGYVNNGKFHKAIKKYGWENFEHIVLFKGLTREKALQKEIELIKEHDSYRIGYNQDLGGYTPSEEHRESISKAQKGRERTPEFRKRISENLRGSCFVTKGSVNKCIEPEELDKYLSEGWSKGINISPERDRQKRENLAKAISGRKHIYKKNLSKMIPEGEVEAYVAKGWTVGRRFSKKGSPKGRKYINKGGLNKIVRDYELEKYLSEGWVIGKTVSASSKLTTTGKKHVNKDGVSTMVELKDYEKYLSEGWKPGYLNKRKRELLNDESL